MTLHVMKSWTHLFDAIWEGKKVHDIRDKTERNFRVGDQVELREFDHTTGRYTGRAITADITYITSNDTPCALSSVVLDNRYAVLSLAVTYKED